MKELKATPRKVELGPSLKLFKTANILKDFFVTKFQSLCYNLFSAILYFPLLNYDTLLNFSFQYSVKRKSKVLIKQRKKAIWVGEFNAFDHFVRIWHTIFQLFFLS